MSTVSLTLLYRFQSQVTRAASSTAADGTELVDPSGFRIEQISFGKILSPIGISLMVYGFGSFFGLLPGGDISSLLLIYGFPISLLGFALAYAQLKPVPCKTTKAAFELRDQQMTDIQKQVIQFCAALATRPALHLLLKVPTLQTACQHICQCLCIHASINREPRNEQRCLAAVERRCHQIQIWG